VDEVTGGFCSCLWSECLRRLFDIAKGGTFVVLESDTGEFMVFNGADCGVVGSLFTREDVFDLGFVSSAYETRRNFETATFDVGIDDPDTSSCGDVVLESSLLVSFCGVMILNDLSGTVEP